MGGNPFTEIWHNNHPFVLTYTNEISGNKAQNNRKFCTTCGIDFPDMPALRIAPYDVCLAHEEAWIRPNPDWYPGALVPKGLPSPRGKLTKKYYCVKNTCILARFPYFNKELIILGNVNPSVGHKNLLNREFGLVL